MVIIGVVAGAVVLTAIAIAIALLVMHRRRRKHLEDTLSNEGILEDRTLMGSVEPFTSMQEHPNHHDESAVKGRATEQYVADTWAIRVQLC